MILPELIIVVITLLAFSLLFILTALRIRSRTPVIYHLALYLALGLGLSAARLAMLVTATPPVGYTVYHFTSRLLLLAFVLAFGILTLNFLKKSRRTLTVYGAFILAILSLWLILTLNLWGWSRMLTANSNLAIWQAGPPAVLLSGAVWVVVLAATLITLTLDYQKRQPAQQKNRLRYWFLATALLAGGGTIFYLLPFSFNWSGLLLLAVGSGLAGYTVLSYQTADLKRLVGRALRYVGVTTALAGVFLLGLAMMVIISRYNAYPSLTLFFWAIFLAVLFAVIFPPLLRVLTRFLTHLIFGKQYPDEKQVIKHYSQRLSSALDIKRLGDTVLNLMIETLGIEQGIVFVNERGSTGDVTLRPLSSIGVAGLTSGQFGTDSPFIDYFRHGNKSLSQYDIEVLPEFRLMSKTEREWLSGLGMELYIPILRQMELVGLLAFGPQPQGTAYYEEDLDLMMALADQTALAMDSARLFEQLAIINREVGTLTDQLAGLDETKSDFLSIASHELRTPLTQIHGFSQMLLELTEEELKDPNYLKTLVEGVARGSERMKGVVDLMFDVTEAQVGDMRLFKGPVSLQEVIDQAVSPFITAMDERRIAFGKMGIKELPVVQADGTRLVQAFENLIGNAIKFTPDGGTVKIEGRTCTLDDIGPAVEIVVSDTGIGIDPEHHEKIFEKFFRVDDTMHHSTGKTKFKGAGPGLGLSLVKGIAEAHKGRVWVESLGHDEVNCPGSKFHFVIPAAEPAEEEKPASPKQSQIATRHWRRSDFMDEDL